MSTDQANASAPQAMDALGQYHNTRPAPPDAGAWFDENYPETARPVLVALVEAVTVVLDILKRHDNPVPRDQMLSTLGEECGLPGWLFQDGSAVCINLAKPELLWTRGDRRATRIVTPQTVLESTLMVEALGARLSTEDIRKATLGPYRDHLHLLLESPDARVRECAIAALGETRQKTGVGQQPPGV